MSSNRICLKWVVCPDFGGICERRRVLLGRQEVPSRPTVTFSCFGYEPPAARKARCPNPPVDKVKSAHKLVDDHKTCRRIEN
jgi:hypothetical protein